MKSEVKKPENTPFWDLVVIGGGPAGMMAAGRAAERGLKVLLLEKNKGLGEKLLITGGGRSNVTNAEFDDRTLLAKFKDSDKFLFSAFSQFSVKDVLDFFNSRGMETKVEAEKRVFPISNNARSVWEVLVENMKKHGVIVRSNSKVNGFVIVTPGKIDGVKLAGGEIVRGQAYVLATGGTSHPETGSTGDGFKWLKEIGHAVADSQAVLVPIEVSDAWVKKISGVSLPSAKITLLQNDVKQAVNKGKVLFTHFGLSGPGILNMSSEVAELMKYGPVEMSLDLLPKHDYSTLNDALQKIFNEDSNKKFKNAIDTLIPRAFIPVIIEKSKINPDTFCHSITREERLNLIKLLKDVRIHPTKLLGADRAIVTSGGISLDEVDFKTMKSRLISNLYVVGDVLNIDRPSGGYSLQLCWTTGWVAGNSALQ